MSKLKNLALWKKLLLSVVIMAAVGALTFWMFANVLAPHLMQIDVEIDASNLTKVALENFTGVEPALEKAYDQQKRSVRAGSSNTASGYNMVAALMGAEAYVCSDCGYAFPSDIDVTKEYTCPNCPAKCGVCGYVFPEDRDPNAKLYCPECEVECTNKPACTHVFTVDEKTAETVQCPDCGKDKTLTPVAVPTVNLVTEALMTNGFACDGEIVTAATEVCGYVFPAGTEFDLMVGLSCPDCGAVYAKPADFKGGFDALTSTVVTIGEAGFTCQTQVSAENSAAACTYVFPAGCEAGANGSLACPECSKKYTAADVAAKLADAPVPACPDCGYAFPEGTDISVPQICPACPLVCQAEKRDENGEKVVCGYVFPEDTDKTVPQFCPVCEVVCGAKADEACGYKFVPEDVTATPECPECGGGINLKEATLAKFSPKKAYQELVDSVKMIGGEIDLTFYACENSIICKEKLVCGHVFTALELSNLTNGLKCPDCRMEYIPAGMVNADLAAALAELPGMVEGGFACSNVETSKNICNMPVPAGTLLNMDDLPFCEGCGHQIRKSDILNKQVTATANKPLVMTFSVEYGSGKAAETRAAADLTLIAKEFDAQVKRMAETYNKNIEHKDNIVGVARKVPNTGVRTMLATAVAVLITGLVLYLALTKESFDLAMRKELAYTVLAILTILCIVFFYILFINATRAHADIQSRFSLLPGSSFAKNWNTLMANEELPIWRGMFNSLLISGCVALLSTYFSVLTAYAIHAYHFKLRSIAFKFILLVMMVPGQVSALGFVEMMNDWGWKNTFWPLILPSVAAPTVFFFMKQYMDSTLPLAIVEAARIDGSSEFGTFNRIVIHIMKPAIAVQAIFSFVGSWNNYFTPALLLNKKEMKTLPILIAQLRSADWLKFDIGQVYMMICLSILPVIVVYLCLSKFIIAGVAVGGVKE